MNIESFESNLNSSFERNEKFGKKRETNIFENDEHFNKNDSIKTLKINNNIRIYKDNFNDSQLNQILDVTNSNDNRVLKQDDNLQINKSDNKNNKNNFKKQIENFDSSSSLNTNEDLKSIQKKSINSFYVIDNDYNSEKNLKKSNDSKNIVISKINENFQSFGNKIPVINKINYENRPLEDKESKLITISYDNINKNKKVSVNNINESINIKEFKKHQYDDYQINIEENNDLDSFKFNKIENKRNQDCIYYDSPNSLKYKKTNYNEEKNEPDKNVFRILIVFDEKLIRQYLLNILRKYLKNKNVIFDIIECKDGIECLYKIYEGIGNEIKYNLIITDEKMNFMKGSFMAKILKKLIIDKVIYNIKIFMIKNYDNENLSILEGIIIEKIYAKPISIDIIESIFNLY